MGALTKPEIEFRSTKARVALVGYRAASDCAGKASTFAVTVLAARRLSPAAFGVFSVAATVGWMLAVGADCGIEVHVARVVARARAHASEVLARWLRLRLRTAAIAVAVGSVGAALALGRGRPAEAVGFAVIVTAYAVSGVIEFVYYFFRGLGRTDLESSLTLAHRLTMLGCASLALWRAPGITMLAAALLIPAVLVLGAALRIARYAGGPSADGRWPTTGSGISWPEFRREVLPLGASLVLSAVYFRIDLLLVGALMGSAAAGSYNAVFRLVDALRLFPAAVLAVVLPTLFRTDSGRPLAGVAASVTAFAIVATAVAEPLAPWLVRALYGAQYLRTIPTLRVLLLAYPLMALNYALTHQLIGWQGQRPYAAICLAALAANLALNAVLIPRLGIDGAAWATLWTEVVLTAGCAWQLRVLAPRRQGRFAAAVTGA